MKIIFYTLIIIILLPYLSFAQCAGINYASYDLVFEDDFDYLCETGAVYAFQADPAFIANWSLTNGDWGAGNEYYYAANATMNTCGIITLTEHDITPFDVGSRHVTKSSGTLISKSGFNEAGLFGPGYASQNGWGYGVIEASIRFPHETSVACGNSGVAFWTGGYFPTEIDIVDDGHEGGVTSRAIDWEYSPPHGKSIGDGSISSGFHTFSCVWNPAYASFYIDGCFKGMINYTTVRTFQDFTTLKFALLSCTGIPDGLSMDIDWVKIWRQKCDATDLDVNDVTCCGSKVIPGMYKNNTITSTNTSPGNATFANDAIMFESGATTINPNFTADESTLTHATVSVDAGSVSQISNGFFEILPIKCGAETSSWYRNSSNKGNTISANATRNNLTIGNNTLTNDAFSGVSQIQVSPNPTQNNITISYPCKSAGQLEIKINDVAGRIRYTESVICDEGNNIQHIVDLSSFSSGVYFVDLTLNDQHVVKKIVKL